VLGLQYTYVSPNNGNVQSQTITFTGFSATQNYGYDPMNRLKTAVEADRDQTNKGWSQTYVFDSAGNRALLSGTAYYIPGGPYTPQVGADDPAQVSTLFPNNRWNGASHGDSGNVIAVVAQAFSYDAENRIVSAAIPNIDSIGYAYDGDGRRVSKTVNGVTTTFVYDATGQLTAEYGPSTDAGTDYLTGDALGSTRVVTDGSAVVKRRYDYLPFGEEIPLGTNGRAAPYQVGGYPSVPPDVVDEKFTGKERDAETGMDFFGARYFAGAQGRFTSPDAFGVDQHPEDPQSWNLYAYARNNPLGFIDPGGEYVCGANVSEDQCNNFQKSLDQSQAAANKLKDKYGADSKQYTDAQRAIDVYGKQNVDNGVVVKIGDTGGWGGVTAVSGTTVAKTKNNPTGQQIGITFQADSFDGSRDAGLNIVHEGSHAADGSDWVRSGFLAAMNPTRYQTEFRAFSTAMDMAGSMGIFEMKFQLPSGVHNTVHWGVLRDLDIQGLLRHGYHTTPNDKLKAFRRNTQGKR